MTPREKDMLNAIRDLTVDGVSPSYTQLMARLGIASKSGVTRMVVSLERQRLIRRRFGCRHALEVVPVSGVSDAEIARMPTADLQALSDRIHRALAARYTQVAA